jgi:hypothetical protein
MRRREFLAAAASTAVVAMAAPAIAQTSGTTFLVCTGAWSAGWSWKKMHPLMAAGGHRLVTPTYTGLGEREHLASPSNDLETHIQDILAVINTKICATLRWSATATAAWSQRGSPTGRETVSPDWSISTHSCRWTGNL